MRLLAPTIAGFLLLLAAVRPSPGSEPPAPSPERPTFWIIPHTHWEGAVFKTREEYLEVGFPNILKALKALGEHPDYRFVLDQVAYVRPFLERHPDRAEEFKKYVAEGRLQIAGALDVMPDVNMPGGESFVRQVQYGKSYYRETLGVDVTTGWLIDTFGHHAQMPQLMRQAGFGSYWTQRGVSHKEHPAEFQWEGIDGTRIPVFYMPGSYALMFGSPADPAQFRDFMIGRFRSLDRNAPRVHRAGPSGADVVPPEPHQVAMIEAFNKSPDAPFTARLSTPAEFEAAISKTGELPVFRGELNPIFQGTYSSRIELKSWMRTMEAKLLTAEKLASIGSTLGVAAHPSAIWRAWEPTLFNETHDLASGVMTDHVHDDVISTFQQSERLADEQLSKGFDALVARIDTRGEGTPVVVFNPLAWARTDVAEVELGFTTNGVGSVEIVDDRGQVRPSQVVSSTPFPEGGLCAAKVAFVAADVPSMGYRTYHARPIAATAPAVSADPSKLENRHYRMVVDPGTGAITSLRVKDGDWEVFKAPANVVARHEDKGDVWELYRGLDGGSNVAMSGKQPVPARGSAKFSDEQRADAGTVVAGPVFTEVRVAHPFDTGDYAATIRIYAELPRIDCSTTLVNREKYTRYQVLFPTNVAAGKRTDEIPFGAIERPEGVEFPAQNWVELGDGTRGLAVLNAGLPGHVVSDATVMVSVLRSHNLGAYGFGGGYEPGMSSEDAFLIDQPRTSRYAILPHAGDWRDAGVARAGLEFNHPLVARIAAPHAGDLPPSRAIVEVSAPNVVASSLKPARDGRIALRLYESAGRPATTTIKLAAEVLGANAADLLETPGEAIAVSDGSFQIALSPFQIRTIVLQVRPRADGKP